MSRNWMTHWWRSGEQPAAEGPADGDENAVEPSARGPEQDGGTAQPPVTSEGVMEALKEVYDPELAIDIVNLGLVYGVDVEGSTVKVRMTLTSPGCPIGPMIRALAQGAIQKAYPTVENVDVDLVWNPPWDPYTMASEEAKDALGIW